MPPDINLPTAGTVKDGKRECCYNCTAYDDDKGYCRKDPPQGNTWSKIERPYEDWCRHWQQGSIEEARMFEPPLTRKSGMGGVK